MAAGACCGQDGPVVAAGACCGKDGPSSTPVVPRTGVRGAVGVHTDERAIGVPADEPPGRAMSVPTDESAMSLIGSESAGT